MKSSPVAALAPNESGLVAWIDHRNGTPQVYGKWLDAEGIPSGADMEFSNATLDTDNSDLQIGRDGAGDYHLIWIDQGTLPTSVKDGISPITLKLARSPGRRVSPGWR